jgi:hypothetical protein
MAGFRKAKAEQAALKIGLYGPPGSGKTFTSLLIAEGLAKLSNKRIAYVDTERGTDFYCKPVPQRRVHPEAFDFDALYTKSLTEVIASVRSLKEADHSVIVLDSITHLWEAARAAYDGNQTRAGTIPMHAWGKIKKPYKELMGLLLSSPMHVLICGRQGVDYAEDEESGELKSVGVKMKAEGETAYEPHILLRMEAIRPGKNSDATATIQAFAEKDRTGILAGRVFKNPTFETLCAPLLGLLGAKQAKIETEEETATKDAEALADEDRKKQARSVELLRDFSARIDLAKSPEELAPIGKTITPEIKAQMTTQDVSLLREKYQEREKALKGERTMVPMDGAA